MKIKLFVDAHVFDSTHQGTSTYIKGLYLALVNDPDFEITLAAHDVDNLRQIFPDKRFKFLALSTTSKFKRLAVEIPSLLKIHNFDYAHFQYITPLKKPCKYINTLHDLLFLEFPRYFPLKYRVTKFFTFGFSALRSDVICTVSEHSKKALVKYFKLDAHTIEITPNAVDPYAGAFIDVSKKYGLGNYLLFVGRFEPRKNHYLLLKTFVEMRLNEQGYSLVMIGKFKDLATKEFDAYFHTLAPNIKQHVFMFENIPQVELNSFYRQATVFVYPSLAEGFGIPPLEAGMLQCKVLCSNKTAMSDFTFFGPYLFDPNNETEFRAKLAGILKDNNYPYSEIRNAILEKYNWHRIAEVLATRLKFSAENVTR